MFVQEVLKRFKEKRPIALMARMAIARVLSPSAIDAVFQEHAEEQYERKIAFSALTEMMASVTFCFSRSVNSAAKQHREKLNAAMSCIYSKLERVEPLVMQALVRYAYAQGRDICNHLRVWDVSYSTGYRTKIVDGQQLRGSQQRRRELRRA